MKKSHQYMITAILTIGASLWLGLLCFSGMFVLIPSLGLALSAFVLSVLYDGEIYQKNINNALNKLFNKDLIAEKIGEEAVKENKTWEFVDEYKSTKDPKRLKKMHIWLGRSLSEKRDSKWEQRALELTSKNRALIGFSALASILMMFGTTYLLLEAISVVTFITIAPAILPYVVLPIAVISGIAYGFLTYNSSSDFLLDTSLSDWWGKFKTQLSSNPFYVIGASLILLLNLALTLCTTGTWWTVINQQRSVWPWLKNISTRAMQWITTGVIGLSTLGFNLRNTIETIKEMSPHEHSDTTCSHTAQSPPPVAPESPQMFNPILLLLKITYTPVRVLMFVGHLISIGVTGDRMPGVPAIFSALLGIISEAFEDAHYFFDIRQFFKNLRLLLKITYTPVRVLMFVGHLISISVTGDRMPGVPAIFSALLGIINEALEDAHYFFDIRQFFKNLRHTFGSNNDDAHVHEHEHEPSDLPNQIIQIMLSPVVALSALWHWGFERSPEPSLTKSWNAVKQDLYGIKPNTPEHYKTEKLKRFIAIRSDEWAREETLMVLEKGLEKCTDTAKHKDLMKFQGDLNSSKLSARNDINAMYERIMFWQPQPQETTGTQAASLSLGQ